MYLVMTLLDFYAKFYYSVFKVLKIILLVVVSTVLAITLAFFISEKLTNSPIHVFAIETDSMSPTIEAGALIISKKQQSYIREDIITYNTPIFDKPVTHRIIEITDEGDFITKGDNRLAKDQYIKNSSDIVGKVIYINQSLGKYIFFLKSVEGIIIFLIIPTTILFTLLGVDLYKSLKDRATE